MTVGAIYRVVIGRQEFLAMYQGTEGPYEIFHTGMGGRYLLLPGDWTAREL